MQQKTHTFTNGLGYTRKRGTLQDFAYQITKLYENEVENHVMNLSISKDVKQQVFNFPCNTWFDEESKAHLKLAKDKFKIRTS